jgi:predicted nucleic acid-binding protein
MAIEITAAESSFVDTNVWLYAFVQTQDPEKSEKAKRIVQNTPAALASTQVINELCVNLLKTIGFSEADIRDIIAAFYGRYHIVEFNQTILRTASEFRMRYQLSFWDSLIAASAFVGGASVLYTEDMHDGLVIEQQLRIVNPFK